jgi:hypothetical protein
LVTQCREDDQQYPPVLYTPGLGQSATRKKCKKTQSKINIRLLAGAEGFWTGQQTCRSFSLLKVQTEYGDFREI